jgi:hypothetical protein
LKTEGSAQGRGEVARSATEINLVSVKGVIDSRIQLRQRRRLTDTGVARASIAGFRHATSEAHRGREQLHLVLHAVAHLFQSGVGVVRRPFEEPFDHVHDPIRRHPVPRGMHGDSIAQPRVEISSGTSRDHHVVIVSHGGPFLQGDTSRRQEHSARTPGDNN